MNADRRELPTSFRKALALLDATLFEAKESRKYAALSNQNAIIKEVNAKGKRELSSELDKIFRESGYAI